MLLLQQCILKMDALRTDRRRLHQINERLVKENAQLQEFHDKACEAKLLSEEQIISHITDLQADLERNLLQNRDSIVGQHRQQSEKEQSPPRSPQSPAKKDASEDTSGIGAALNNATKSDIIHSSLHRARKRRTAKAETIKQAEPVETNNKRLKASSANDLISQLE